MRKHLLFFILTLYVISAGPAKGQGGGASGSVNLADGVVLWLDAADVNGNEPDLAPGASVTVWKDKSNNGHDATVAAGNQAGTFHPNQINGYPVVRFNRSSNSSGSVYAVNGLDLRAGKNPDVTIITVYKQGSQVGTPHDEAIWGIDNGAWDRFFFTHKSGDNGYLSLGPAGELTMVPGAGKTGALNFVTAIYDGNVTNGTNSGPTNSSAVYLNGKLISKFTDTTHPTDAQTGFRIGSDGNDNVFNGDIAEVIVYNRKLNNCEIESVNAYLNTKYKVTVATNMAARYSLPAPHTNEVSGIGMDCFNGTAINSATSGILTIANPSANNTPGDYLTFGNDNGGYTLDFETPPTYLTRLKQEWRVDMDASVGTVDVCFDLNNLNSSTIGGINFSEENFALLIDADGDFNDAVIQVTGRSVSGGKVCFSGITLAPGSYISLTTQVAPVPNKIAGSLTNRKASFTKATVIDDQVTVTGVERITDARVYIETGFQPGDLINFPGTLPAGVTQSYDAATGGLSFTGTATSAQWQAIFRQVTFLTTSPDKADRTFKFVLGNFVSFIIDGKPHYYQFVMNQYVWTNAINNAASKRLFGLKGYLATITSAAENNFIKVKLLKDGWIGGSDSVTYVNAALGTNVFASQAAVEGKWYWVTGPEKGTPISSGNNRPVAVADAFTNWEANEPNNRQNIINPLIKEHFMHFYAQKGVWNDFSKLPSLGYLLEFGGYSNDPVLEIEHTRTLNYYKMLTPSTPVLVDGVDNLTKDNTPAITGTAEANATVTLYVNGVRLTTVKASAEGFWSYTFPTALADGTHAVTVTAEDADSDVSDASPALNIRIDTTAPIGYTVAFNTEQVNVKTIATTALQIAGTEAGTTLYYTITSNNGGTAVTGTMPVTATAFDISTLDLTGLADGTLTATIYAQDVAGNKGAEVTGQTMKVMRNIVSVKPLALLHVSIRTTFEQLQRKLPAKVEVTYNTGTKEEIEVTWSPGNYNGMVLGQYTLPGTLVPAALTTNLDNISTQILVEVEPNKAPTDITLSATTFKPEATANEAIGTFTTTDPDDTEFVYTLITGQGDGNNSLFEIRGDKLYLKSNKGLSGLTQFSIRVKSTDTFGNAFEKAFVLTKGQYTKAADQLKIVNAFSPNGDGTNDTWTVPELKYYNNIKVEVFDRAGVRLFQTTNPEQGWDGKDQHGQVLKGAFFFVIQVKDIDLVKRGVVTVIK